MARITKTSIQEVINRIDAIAVVEDYIRLEKRGGRYWGRCPFHGGGQEKTPSFKVEPDQKLYYCFGCSKGGSIVDFVMEMDKVTFPEAIRNLARKFGVELTFESSGDASDDEDWKAERSRKEQLFELYRRTAVTFSHFLLEKPEGKPALDYLLSRSITPEMIQRFRLGYSPSDRNWLYRFLQGKGYSEEFLDNSGLFSANYKGVAFFSNRLMFPIADKQGQVAAFGGRAMPGATQTDGNPPNPQGEVPLRSEPPKYINTREMETYKKGQVLYALDLALPEIRRSKTVYIAEGYMDVIALHQAGVTNAVAPCGTAFTDEQARFLRRWAETAVLVFDSDEAGQKAAVKGIITCRKNGLACSLVAPGEAENRKELKDPADILKEFGPEVLNKSMKCVIMDFGYLIARGKSLYDTSMPQGKAQALAVLYPFFDALESNTERDTCMEAAADEMRTDKSMVLADYERWRRSNSRAPKDSNIEEVPATVSAIRRSDELLLLTVVSVNANLYPEFRTLIEIREIEDMAAKELFVALEECFRNEESGPDALLPYIASQNLRNFIIEQRVSPEFKGDEKRSSRKIMEDGVKRVKGKWLRRRLTEIGAELRLNERISGERAGGDNEGLIEDLIAEKMHIDAEIRKLEGKTG